MPILNANDSKVNSTNGVQHGDLSPVFSFSNDHTDRLNIAQAHPIREAKVNTRLPTHRTKHIHTITPRNPTTEMITCEGTNQLKQLLFFAIARKLSPTHRSPMSIHREPQLFEYIHHVRPHRREAGTVMENEKCDDQAERPQHLWSG